MNPKKSNIIVGTICKHPSMDFTDFNSNYGNSLLEKISKEQKSVFPFFTEHLLQSWRLLANAASFLSLSFLLAS